MEKFEREVSGVSPEELDKAIREADKELKGAKEYLSNIRKWYATTPDLLRYYEPYAVQMADACEGNLRELRKRKSAMEEDGA